MSINVMVLVDLIGQPKLIAKIEEANLRWAEKLPASTSSTLKR